MVKRYHINKANDNGEITSVGVNVHVPNSTWIGLGCSIGVPLFLTFLLYIILKKI